MLQGLLTFNTAVESSTFLIPVLHYDPPPDPPGLWRLLESSYFWYSELLYFLVFLHVSIINFIGHVVDFSKPENACFEVPCALFLEYLLVGCHTLWTDHMSFSLPYLCLVVFLSYFLRYFVNFVFHLFYWIF